VIGDLSSRRGGRVRGDGIASGGLGHPVDRSAGELLGYATDLRRHAGARHLHMLLPIRDVPSRSARTWSHGHRNDEAVGA